MLRSYEHVEPAQAIHKSEPTSASDPKPVPISHMQTILQGLLEVLEQEKDHLASGKADMPAVFAKKKMQCFVQMNSLMKRGNTAHLARIYQLELRKVDQLLKENAKKLEFRMKAIGEITDTIESAVASAESDGTYEAGSIRGLSLS